MSQKTIIFDFDYTLFETKELSQLIKTFFLEKGVPKDVYDLINTLQREKAKGNFSFLDQIAEVKKQGYTISQREVDDFMQMDLVPHLKGPVLEILNELKEKGYKLIMLTKGVDHHQRFKIRQAGIEHFFKDHIYICEERKEEVVKKIPIEGKVYFVNDNADEIEAVMKVFPDINFIYVKGPKTAHDHFLDHKNVPTISDISELREILLQILVKNKS